MLYYLHLWPETSLDVFFLRTLPDIQDLLEPLAHAISKMLIPAITEHMCSRLDRDILALPVRLGARHDKPMSEANSSTPPLLKLPPRWSDRS